MIELVSRMTVGLCVVARKRVTFALLLALCATTSSFAGDIKASAEQVMSLLQSCRAALGKGAVSAAIRLERDQDRWKVIGIDLTRAESATTVKALRSIESIESLQLVRHIEDRPGAVANVAPIEGVDEILALPNLKELRCTPGSLSQVSPNTIESLTLVEDRLFCDAVMRNLPLFKKLRILTVSRPSDAFVVAMSKSQSLEEIHIRNCDKLTDASLISLCKLKNLRVLRLPGRELSQSVLRELSTLPNLRDLQVDSIKSEDVILLRALPVLERLNAIFEQGSYDLRDLATLNSLHASWRRPNPGEPPIPLILPRGLQRILYSEVFDPSFADGEGAGLEAANVYGHQLSWLRRAAALRELTVHDPTTRDLEFVARLHGLRTLIVDWHGSNYDDQGLLALATLRDLERLENCSNCSFPQLADKGMAVLDSFPNLKVLKWQVYGTTTKAFEHIWKRRRLRSLNLDVTEHDNLDSVLRRLESLEELEELCIPGRVTDDGLMCLVVLKKLRYLDLRQNDGFTDSGLASLLDKLPSLRTVEFELDE